MAKSRATSQIRCREREAQNGTVEKKRHVELKKERQRLAFWEN